MRFFFIPPQTVLFHAFLIRACDSLIWNVSSRIGEWSATVWGRLGFMVWLECLRVAIDAAPSLRSLFLPWTRRLLSFNRRRTKGQAWHGMTRCAFILTLTCSTPPLGVWRGATPVSNALEELGTSVEYCKTHHTGYSFSDNHRADAQVNPLAHVKPQKGDLRYLPPYAAHCGNTKYPQS